MDYTFKVDCVLLHIVMYSCVALPKYLGFAAPLLVLLFVKEAGPEFYKGYVVHRCMPNTPILTTINIGEIKVNCWQLLGDLQRQKRLITFISTKMECLCHQGQHHANSSVTVSALEAVHE